MTLKEDIEQDIIRFFRDIEDQLSSDKRKTLKLLMDKYLHLTTATLLLEKNDFEIIKEHAITFYNERSWPKKLSKWQDDITGNEITIICLIESTIMHLNSRDCFKKLPKFNYKE